MELSQMEHEVNEAWIMLSDDMKLARLQLIMSNNPPTTSDIRLLDIGDAALIKMCIGYVTMKSTYEKVAAAQLQRDYDEPPYTKKPE